jgi:predicted transcriptional regulator of viral defense system
VNALNALAKLRGLGTPVVETADAAATLRQTTAAASQTLKRLAGAGLITPVRHGTFWVEGPVDPLRMATYLTAPNESYVSLQTALHLHGLIEQIPEVTYAATLARTQRIVTTAGTFSFHHVAPEVFGGFEETSRDVRIASAEKALFDVAYLSGGRSRLFAAVPELELPKRFRRRELLHWIDRIPSARARTLTSRRLEAFLARASSRN